MKFSFFLFFVLVFLILTRPPNNGGQVLSAVSMPRTTSYLFKPTLNQIFDSTLGKTDGTWGVAILDLKKGESFYKNEHTQFEAGSLYKLWLMACTYGEIQTGNLTESQILLQNRFHLNNEFGIPSFNVFSTGFISYSVSDALLRAISFSDNEAALLLTDKVGSLSLSLFLKQNVLNESTINPNSNVPTTTPYDILLFFKKLYEGKLANRIYTKKMIDLLKNQQLNNALPKYLPDNIIVAHKTGEIDTFFNDAGIVYGKSGNYIIVVFSNTNSNDDASLNIALFSKEVYEYFNDSSKIVPLFSSL